MKGLYCYTQGTTLLYYVQELYGIDSSGMEHSKMTLFKGLTN